MNVLKKELKCRTFLRAEYFLYFNNGRILGGDLVLVGCVCPPPPVLRLLSVLGHGSVVVDFLLIVTRLWESVVALCIVVRYYMSVLVLQSS